MSEVDIAVHPTAHRKSRFLTALVGIREEDLRGNREYSWVAKAVDQGLQKFWLDLHVVIQQHNDVILRGADACVRTATEAQISAHFKHSHRRELTCQVLASPVVRGVVDDQDFVIRI